MTLAACWDALLLLGAAVAGLGALVAELLYHHRWGCFFIPLYTRFKEEELLQHSLRRRIYHLVEKYPGQHYAALAHLAGVKLSTLKYHLGMLERAGYVHSERAGRCRYFYPVSVRKGAYKPLPLYSFSSSPKAIEHAILRNLHVHAAGLNAAQLAELLGISLRTVRKYLHRMAHAGVVQAVQAQGTVSYILTAPYRASAYHTSAWRA